MIFINKIQVNECRNIRKLDIPLSSTKLQHLIITGKNGSGKTSLLSELKNRLLYVENDEFFNVEKKKNNIKNLEDIIKNTKAKVILDPEDKISIQNLRKRIYDIDKWLNSYNKVKIYFTNLADLKKQYNEGKYIIAFFEANRYASQNIPKSIAKYDLKDKFTIEEKVAENFLQYIVNLRADQAFARNEGDFEDANKIDNWFANFEKMLRKIYNSRSLKLEFDRKNYTFDIVEKKYKRSPITKLADGHSAILSIITELLLRMEKQKKKIYNLDGIVLIDEIETHLHIDLQKKILPILISLFPNIQFIVTTHSPFVLSSISNTVICDLENKFVTEDLSGYSSEVIIESYFNSDKYSLELKEKIDKYEKLVKLDKYTDEVINRIVELEGYLDKLPKYLSPELEVKIQQLSLLKRNKVIDD